MAFATAFMSAPDTNEDVGANSWLIDEMREAYDADPQSVDASWRAFFEGQPKKPAAATPDKPEPKPTPTPEPSPAVNPAPVKAEAAPKAEPKPAAKVEQKKDEPKKADKPKADTKARQVEQVLQGGETPANPGTGAGLSANAPNPALRPAPPQPNPPTPCCAARRCAPRRTWRPR